MENGSLLKFILDGCKFRRLWIFIYMLFILIFLKYDFDLLILSYHSLLFSTELKTFHRYIELADCLNVVFFYILLWPHFV